MIAAVRQRLRLRYRKDDILMWTGHLDVMRLVLRLLRRIGAPIATSGKFSPKPRITFGPPLSVGVSADAELLDIELHEDVVWSADEIQLAAGALAQAAMPRDFVVALAELAPDTPTIAQATYGGRYLIGVAAGAPEALQAVQSGGLVALGRDGKSAPAAKGLLSITMENNLLKIDGRAMGNEVFNVMRLAQCLESAGFEITHRCRCGLIDQDGQML